MIKGEHILIFGGSGSLGNQIIGRYLKDNKITNYSRDECKHWKMGLKYKSDKLDFVIGDIRDADRVENTLLRVRPTMIIIAAALKHIDRCEYATNESIGTNITGVANILNSVEKHQDSLRGHLKAVCFVSTDKACSPVNVYGMCKAISETLFIEKSLYVKGIKFVGVRYGNVLNSRGSIIPILHKKGLDPKVEKYTLTHADMTRFVMTLDQSVDLIQHAILHGQSGDIVIPKLVSLRVMDLFEIFSEKYNKPIIITGLRPGEKLLESLINETQSLRLVKGEDDYSYIRPPYIKELTSDQPIDYNSRLNPLSKDELREYLQDLDLLEYEEENE